MFSKALLFLFFQIVENKHNEAGLQAFFLFFPTKNPCQCIKTLLGLSSSLIFFFSLFGGGGGGAFENGD